MQYVEVAVSIEVRDLGVVPALAGRQNCGAKLALTVAVQNPCRGVGIIEDVGQCGPLSLFGCDDIQVAIAVDIRKFLKMSQ
jgi:hypothetical protein